MFEISGSQLSLPWTSSAADSPARTFPLPASELASEVLAAACGLSSGALFQSFTRSGWWLRMSPVERLRGLTLSLMGWESLGTRCYRSRFRQRMSVLRMNAHGSSLLLPTLTAQSYGTNLRGAAGRTGKVRESLHQMAKRGTLLPTLTRCGNMLSPSMQKWPGHRLLPTLVARDSKGPGPTHTRAGRDLPQLLGGHLSPTFCEWLMGFPQHWTEPIRNAKHANKQRARASASMRSVTRSCRSAQR